MEDVLFIFDFISGVFGYILWFLFEITQNYGTATILFALVVNILTFPIVVKRIQNTASNEKFEAKKEKLKKRFGNDPQRFNKELLELSQKEGVNPFQEGGLFATLLTFVMLGLVYSSVNHPLTNVLHLPKDKVSQAVEVLTDEQRRQKGSDQLDLVRSFDENKSKLTMFDNEELEKISKYSKGFSFLGLNLLNIPKFSKFSEFLWILPAFSFIFSIFGSYVMQKASGMSDEIKGAGKIFSVLISLFQAWIVSRVFGAVGLYFIMSGVMSTIQMLVVERFFSPYLKKAKKEKKLFYKLLNDSKNDKLD